MKKAGCFMRALLVYLKDYKKETILAPLFKMLEASFELLVPLVMAAVIDTGIGRQDRGYIVKMCLVLIGLGIIGLVCSLTAQYFSAKAASCFGTGVRHALFEHIQRLTFSDMDKVGSSTLIARTTSDVNQAQAGVNLVLRLFLRSPFIVFGAMIMAFTVDVRSAVVFVVVIPLLSLIVFGIMMITMPLYRKVQKNLDEVLLTTRENLAGARVIRAFNNEETERERFRTENEMLSDAQKFVGRISGLMNPMTYVVVNGGIVALLYTGALRVDIGDLTQGQVVALINYMSQILVELVKLANLIITVTKAVACGNRIESILKIRPGMSSGGLRWEAAGTLAVEFEKVSLTYEDAGAESLSDLTFCVRKGQTIGIIGGTGSGKSSLVNLIPRFYDATKGKIKIFGKDIKEYDLDSLRSHIGVVFQKAALFKGSIAENLRWGNESASKEELERALEISQAADFVYSKPGQMDFQIEQGGRNLSGGQRQRLTIARALVRKPDILILDDSASALDYATDAALRKSIREMEEQVTVFIVSQRAASLLYADKIIVLDEGEVVGQGTHEELLEACPAYREIYYSQFPREEETVSSEVNTISFDEEKGSGKEGGTDG